MANDYNAMVVGLDKLDNNQKKDLAVKTLGTLPEGDKGEVANRSGLGLPSQGPTDIIWLVVVIALALILVATSGALVYGVVFLQRTADNVQIILTIFTTVVGFIAGLLTPSPLQTNKK
jgi:hypothetical protein